MNLRILCIQAQYLNGLPVRIGLLDEDTYSFAIMETNKALALIREYGCLNVTLKNGSFNNEEIAKLPHITLQNEIYKNNGIFVIGRIVKNAETIGYKFATPFGKVQSFDSKQAIAIATRTSLINGIIVNNTYIKGKGFNLPVAKQVQARKSPAFEKSAAEVKEKCEDTDALDLTYVDFESLVYDKLDAPDMPQFLLKFIGFNHYEKGIMTNQALAWAFVKRSNKSVNQFIKILKQMPV